MNPLFEKYFALIESFCTNPADFETVLHPEFTQIEYPNAITPRTAVNGLLDVVAGAVRGKALLSSQKIEVINLIAQGDQVVIEAHWQGKVAHPKGPFRTGQVIEAWLCMVFVLKEGKIWQQRNYDCYPSFS